MSKITREDRIVIKALWVEKNWSSRCFLKEFASKAWCRSSLNRLIKTIDAGLPVDGVIGRGRRQPVKTAANVTCVEKLICSQEDAPSTRKSLREIEWQTGISRSSVQWIAKLDLNLKTFKRLSGQKLSTDNKQKRLERCQTASAFSDWPKRTYGSVVLWWKDLHGRESCQYAKWQDLYSSADAKKEIPTSRLVREREHFSRSVMVSLAVSKVGKTSIVFVEPGAKVNSDYYCTRVLGQGLLPDIIAKCGRYRWTLAHRRTRLATPSRTCGVRISPSSNRTCGHPTART